jgi:hypothetical protein
MYSLIKKQLDEIIKSIEAHDKIAKQITGVFYSIPANQPYPFIHLSNISMKNYGVKNTAATDVTFELTIYTKAIDFERLNRISESLIEVIKVQSFLIIKQSKIELSNKSNIYENKIILKFIMHEAK